MRRAAFPLLLFLCTIGTLHAAWPPADLAAYRQAAARLEALIAQASNEGRAEALKTAEVAALVATLSDESRYLPAASYTVDELPVLMEICGIANKLNVGFAMFGDKALLSRAAPDKLPEIAAALMRRNSQRFQDEYKELQPFLFRCMAREIPPLTRFALSLKPQEMTEARRQGVAQMRTGLMQLYAGALRAGEDTALREDYRLALLSTLAETVESFVPLSKLPERLEISQAADHAGARAAAPYKPYLQRIAQAFRNDRCEGLCSIP